MLNMPVADPSSSATTPGAGSSGFTAGSVVFADATGALNQDNANLFWDDTNNFLGVGTATPSARVHIVHAGIAAAETSGLSLVNSTAATALVPIQRSPGALSTGHAWDTDTAQNDQHDWMTQVVPANDNTTTSIWAISSRVKRGAGVMGNFGNRIRVYNSGAVEFFAAVSASTGNGYFAAYRADGFALYAAATAGGASVGSSGVDVHTAGLLNIGAATATGVALSKVGGVSTLLGTMTHTYSAIGTAQTVVHSIVNATAAQAGAQQYSGVFELGGQGMATDTTTMAVKWGLQVRPVQGAAAPTSTLDFLSSINGAAYGAYKMTVDSTGSLVTAGYITATLGLAANAAIDYALYAVNGGARVNTTYGYDAAAAGVLPFGKTTATSVQIGPGAVGTTGTPTTALITQAIHTGGAATILKVTGAACTGQTASTEASDVLWDFSRSVEHATGALTLQRGVVFDVQTEHKFVGASVVSNAVGLHITAGPTRGTNAEITSTIGVYIGAIGSTGGAATTYVISAAAARFAQMGFSDDTVSFIGGTGVTATTAPVSSLSLGQLTVAGDTAICTVATAATLYVKGAPIAGQNVAITSTYAIFADAGLCRFDGDGTRVFELPADATGNATAAVGRIPVLIGGGTKYLRYYND